MSNFSKLAILDISHNDFEGNPFSCLPNSLKQLYAGSNRFSNFSSHRSEEFKNLEVLDMSENSFTSLVRVSFGQSPLLKALDLRSNQINGSIHSSIGQHSRLRHLDLSGNQFSGSIPISIGQLSSLEYLDVGQNFNLSGNIPHSIGQLSRLQHLDFSGNQLSGNIPTSIGNLSRLQYLNLRENQLSGKAPSSIGQLSRLQNMDLSDNKLSGNLHSSIGQLSKLETLYLNDNSLEGVVSEFHFHKLTSLRHLNMASNFMLVVNTSTRWVPPFQLLSIVLSSCQIPQFPQWLRTQGYVDRLIISNASISGTLPDWFGDVFSKATYLDISHNKIGGKIPNFKEFDGSSTRSTFLLNSNKFEGSLTGLPTNFAFLDISDNLLSGHIVFVDKNASRSPSLEALILSNNRLIGGIPADLCNITTLQFVELSKNQLSGGIPRCMEELKELMVLDLGDNGLHGDIPTSLGVLQSLLSLHLRHNKLQGKLPCSLQNLKFLSTLDLSKNEFTGTLPPWIGEKLVNLQFLSLGSNKLHGGISPRLCQLDSLHLLNMADNYISGHIPSCFGNFSSMFESQTSAYGLEYGTKNGDGRIAYEENILNYVKGIELEYTKTLGFLKSIDLSDNGIAGHIPKELTNLTGLQNLNLSGNRLNGKIQTTISNLKQLESLDLSRNQLSGSIPPTLSDLHFLSHLNLSFKNLSARIPTGYQLQTINDPSINQGNNQLCGAPHLKNCPGDESPSSHDHDHDHDHVGRDDEDESESIWFYTGIGPGFSVGFLGVCGLLHLKRSWRYAYYGFVEKMCDWLFVAIAVKVNRIRRELGNGDIGR